MLWLVFYFGVWFMCYLLFVIVFWVFFFNLIGEYFVGQVDSYFVVFIWVFFVGLVFFLLICWCGVELCFVGGVMLVGVLQFGIIYVCLYLSFNVLMVFEVLLFIVLMLVYVVLFDDLFNCCFNFWVLVVVLVVVLGVVIICYDGIIGEFFQGFLLL